jgi:hypothetical protein
VHGPKDRLGRGKALPCHPPTHSLGGLIGS